jgi:hypothetical protein
MVQECNIALTSENSVRTEAPAVIHSPECVSAVFIRCWHACWRFLGSGVVAVPDRELSPIFFLRRLRPLLPLLPSHRLS